MLINEFGIDASRVETDGKGETLPVADNKTKEGKQPTAELNLSNYNKSKLKPYNMKQISSMLIAALSLLTFGNTATAQKDTSTAAVYKTWDDLLTKMKKDKKTDGTTDARLKAVSEQWAAGINKSLSVKPAKEPWKEWTSTNQHTTGDINLLPLIDEVPAPIYILSLAGQTDIDAKFDPYIKKIESQQKQLARRSQKTASCSRSIKKKVRKV